MTLTIKTRELVELELIDDNPWQPRQVIDQEELRELADSIRELGLLQTPLGRRTEAGRVQSAFGHRRVASCRLLHSEGHYGPQVEMDLSELTDEAMAIVALTENIQRKQLTQVEVVRAHKRAIEKTGLTIQSLAEQLGLDRSTLSNNLRVLELPDFVLEYVESGDLKVSAAREFLVLQNSAHAHTEDMRKVIGEIARTWGRNGAPDWSGRHIRQLISRRVSVNEDDFRPLGPRLETSSYSGYEGGATREATFDVELFAKELPDTLHTIPMDGRTGNEKYEGSRLWTCDVKEWRKRQTKATREANSEGALSGQAPASPKGKSRDQQMRAVLADDPVWRKIAEARAKKGRDLPANDQEREQMGTRAELREVPSHGGGFWKKLQRARPEDVYDYQRESGGFVPPWFPDLKECQKCTIGAAYATARDTYTLRQITLCCFNKEHYQEKLQAGEAKYRAKMKAQRKGIERKDRKSVKELKGQLGKLPESALQSMASALVAASPTLEWQHPLGAYHDDYSYESEVTAKVRELLGVAVGEWRRTPATTVNLDGVPQVATDDLPELVASLLTHHLRFSGQLDTVSQETLATPEEDDC